MINILIVTITVKCAKCVQILYGINFTKLILGYSLVGTKQECGGDEINVYGELGGLTSIDQCAIACKDRASMFAFGTNAFGDNRYFRDGGKCLCETHSEGWPIWHYKKQCKDESRLALHKAKGEIKTQRKDLINVMEKWRILLQNIVNDISLSFQYHLSSRYASHLRKPH